MADPVLPQRARVVVVGGGVIGCSVAYHLAHAGWTDVLLLERDQLTSGTTWHSAGLIVTFGSTSETSTDMRMYTRDLYARLEEETGLSTGFKPVGFIEVATDADRLEEYRRVAAFNRYVRRRRPRDLARARWRSCSPWPAPTTSWPASTCTRTAAPTRPTSRSRWPRARAARRADRRGRAGDRLPHRPRRGRRGPHALRRRRGRGGRQLRRHVGASARASWPGSPSRCRRPSTTTSSPSRSRA